MRHRNSIRKLGRTRPHRRAMLGNMATSLFKSSAVVTTVPKARVLRSVAEKLITLGKRGDLHARRLAARQIHDKKILQKLFNDIAPQFATRPGGYTRVFKLGQRRGDGAPMARLELLTASSATTDADTDDSQSSDSGGKKADSKKSDSE